MIKTINNLKFFYLLIGFLLAACEPDQAYILEQPVSSEQPLLIPSETVYKIPTELHITSVPQIIESASPVMVDRPTSSIIANSTPVITQGPSLTIKSEPFFSETMVITDAIRSGQIFWWRYRTGYVTFEFYNFYESLHQIMPIDVQVPPPVKADGWLFGSQKEKIAFLYRNVNETLELWTADLDLKYPQKLWVDEENWLGSEKDIWNFTQFSWGPGEGSVLIESMDAQTVVYSFIEQKAFFFPDGCNWIVQSRFSGKWSQVCRDGSQVTLLEVDGSLKTIYWHQVASLIATVAQSIFNDGSRAVYVDPNYQFVQVDASGGQHELPFHWTGPIYSFLSYATWITPIQWTSAGDRILVFALSENEDDCPYAIKEDGERSYKPCWLLLENDKIVWRLQREKLEEEQMNWNNLYTYYEAAISPLDNAVILVIKDTPIDYVLISSFQDGRIEVLSNGEYYKMVWKLIP